MGEWSGCVGNEWETVYETDAEGMGKCSEMQQCVNIGWLLTIN